ncbi:MAG TPA: SRPBCC family protein [Sphingomicrobium sp.]
MRGMDITATRTIAAAPGRVAAVMFDPARDPAWIGGAHSVDPPSGDPTALGARTTRHGGFMGRKFSWTTEVVGFEPDRLLDMKFVAGPMKGGGVTYRIEQDGEGSRVSIRNSGPGPQLMGWFVKRSVGKDLDRLAKLVT